MAFEFNEISYALMEQMNLSKKQLLRLRDKIPREVMTRSEVDALLSDLFPNPKKAEQIDKLF